MITKREIIFSISILSIMIILGFFISDKICDYAINKNEIYNKSIKIESSDVFRYSMDTNVGNAFVYGDLNAVDEVSYDEIDGKFIYIKKVKEKYTMHTRTVTTTTNGKTHTQTRVYWSWDKVGEDEKMCSKVTFLNTEFDTNKFLMTDEYLCTINENGHIRYKYYVINSKNVGTIFGQLKNNTISENGKVSFYKDKNLNETYEMLTLNITCYLIVFWVLWILISLAIVFKFCQLENEWLY